ncbi:hypothetical protein BN7_4664 [Wickerhamomyces ciferrii]|uniref:Uncharacterized protein n=1 Tax=Wickerhamomyces ciferrii (strain ATCC 14091 / BCRC 22168 / CBS 111 / JCM 3599 / NBRC 0793 / NRRL Y-1031 F-60-10) TaxID=1206466 RepID=K0KPY1_WICCF|nr:uncharacterized protein BN7_4664 [Wickerhamomyces ciferrii]CCH45086.1 hypothetical protein BN7_4664 [Wickerhamomyces ciferrii]
MGLLDNVKNAVGEENFNKAQSALSGSGSGKDGESTDYVKKAEGYIGEDRLKDIKSKVGEDNFKKGEDYVRSQFGGNSSEKKEESK